MTLAEMAVEKGATTLLVPVSARKQMFTLSDDMATKVDMPFYADAREALLKALAEYALMQIASIVGMLANRTVCVVL